MAISFMKLILVASMALAAYLVSSRRAHVHFDQPVVVAVETAREGAQLHGGAVGVVAADDVVRSGRMKSWIAAPSLRSPDWKPPRTAALDRVGRRGGDGVAHHVAVPTGTVDLFTTTR